MTAQAAATAASTGVVALRLAIVQVNSSIFAALEKAGSLIILEVLPQTECHLG